MNWWDDALHRATIEVLLAGALAGLIGVQVVLRRLSFFTMALTHGTFPGVVAASIVGVNILVGGVVAGGMVALGVAALSRRRGQNAASATGVLLSAGFALGAGLVATQSGFSRELSSFLVGSILTVTLQDLMVTAVALAVVAGVLLAGGRPLAYTAFDRTGARAAGFATGVWDVVLLLTIQVVVVTIVPAVGTILAVALIVAPAAAARPWSARLSVMSGLAVVFGAVSGIGGLYVSARWNIAAGASITLTATLLLALSLLLSGSSAVTGRAWRGRHLSGGSVTAPTSCRLSAVRRRTAGRRYARLMSDKTLPAPIQTFIDATNAADNDAYLATFTDDAYVRDYGREFTGREGAADWNRTDNIGVNMRFDVLGVDRTGPDTYDVTIRATSRRFNGTGTLRFTLRDNLISRLEIG